MAAKAERLPLTPAARRAVAAALRRDGLLLLADRALPSVVALVAGGPVPGSWWGHPAGTAIYNLSQALGDRPDLLAVKLVSGKVTFVDRRLWPDLLASVAPPAPWQTAGLSAAARALLAQTDACGTWRPPASPAVKELADRLLALTTSEHTESGAHATCLTSWASWAAAAGVVPAPDPEAARRRLAALVGTLNRRWNGQGRLPWVPRQRAARTAKRGQAGTD